MVKNKKTDITETTANKGEKDKQLSAKKISASTPHETCTEALTAFGGLFALIKFFDLVGFEQIFEHCFTKPERTPKLGHYRMVLGVIVLLFIGFTRIGHFSYIRCDALVIRFFQVACLPVVSTFWRYVNSLGINQSRSLLQIAGVLRERVWQQCGINHERIAIDIDTTVETVFGEQQGARVGHNPRNRGKKGYRPIVAFIEQTREYVHGKLRSGTTVSGQEAAQFIREIGRYLPGCVKAVLVRADSEFFSWETIRALVDRWYDFIISAKSCHPPFDPAGWYRLKRGENIEYNECVYAPIGWGWDMRFVAMRIEKEPDKQAGAVQQELFEEDRYTYRIFCTSRREKPHAVIEEYDKRADVENLVGEAKREGLEAIPSKKFKNNAAWFQLVMLSYNIWRYLKILAHKSIGEQASAAAEAKPLHGIQDNTIRIARLKLLYIAAKTPYHGYYTTVKYSEQDMRTPGLMRLLDFLDEARRQTKAWLNGSWQCRFSLNTS